MDDELESSTTTQSSSSLATSRRKGRRNCTRDTAIIDKLLNGTGYNKFRIPNDDGVKVSVQFWINTITSINEITNDFEMDIYINEVWIDPALNFENLSPCKHNLSLSHQVLDRLWTPNSCFINSKFAEIHDSPFKNVFLMLYPNGTVWVNYRVKVKGPCAMSLELFPLDIQECFLIYESFNYNNQEVRMRWAEDSPFPVVTMTPIVLPDFDLVKISPTLINAPYPAGWWDELHVRLTFERRYIWYFMQAYLPTYLTIFISWISFSLGPRAIPARTMLGVNALLAMIFQFGNIMRNLPRVSYIKAIDVWMLMSMTFVFCSLLELAIVGYKVKNEEILKKRGYVPKKAVNHHVNMFESSPAGLCRYEKRFVLPLERSGLGWSLLCRLREIRDWPPEKIDHISAFIFPACFALFNILYWSFYYHKKLRQIAHMKL
ncbi:Cation transporter family protein [Teladorsagia circumcincta]|uniref:Cation transporter family protein n=1 Tax=Teladorsagia circumcincta TaxID=45464 RepID=A0A2G9UIW2_TELCI|nr:Cation transporter family protein [Teladorsagia circumcincta]